MSDYIIPNSMPEDYIHSGNKHPLTHHPLLIKDRGFDEYKERFKDLFKLEKTDNGIITARWYSKDENGKDISGVWNGPLHRGIGQLCTDISQDGNAECLILGGYGHDYIASCRPDMPEDINNRAWVSYEHMYHDGCNSEEAIVNSLNIPTIGVINGPGFHVEMPIFCDITLMADDAVFFDPHFTLVNMVPGDGIQIAMRECMGIKKANYYILTGKKITAQDALELGLVNEVVPKDQIYDRAMELAQDIMKKERSLRRTTVDLLRRPWKKILDDELRLSFGYEMWQYMCHIGADHDGKAIGMDDAMADLGAAVEGNK